MKTNCVACCLLLVVLSGCVLAETPARVKGAVTDPSGARISGARILIRPSDNPHEGIPDQRLVADSNGEFAVDLLPGLYDVVLTANGFETITEKLKVRAGERIELNRMMKISNVLPDDFGPSSFIATITSDVPDRISEPVTKKHKK